MFYYSKISLTYQNNNLEAQDSLELKKMAQCLTELKDNRPNSLLHLYIS